MIAHAGNKNEEDDNLKGLKKCGEILAQRNRDSIRTPFKESCSRIGKDGSNDYLRISQFCYRTHSHTPYENVWYAVSVLSFAHYLIDKISYIDRFWIILTKRR